MPELPEMQALAERLDAAVAGSELAGFEPIQFSALKTVQPDPTVLLGRTLLGIGRRAKYLVWDFGAGLRLLIHLSQGGRVDVEDPPKRTRPSFGVVRLRFQDRPSILVKEFGTERKAGWWVVAEGGSSPLDGLGPEVRSDEFADWVRTAKDTRRVHTILRDQRTVAGMGRGYADDALHRAKLSPYATLASLNDDERGRLLEAIHDVLEAGLAAERKRRGGLPTKVGDHWIVHHRHGEPCPVCGDTLHRVSYDAYELNYCPTCQTGGRILADRRMSRLLK